MANWPFRQGVHNIGTDVYGYVQPDGTWGWSNAGLVSSRGEMLLIDDKPENVEAAIAAGWGGLHWTGQNRLADLLDL